MLNGIYFSPARNDRGAPRERCLETLCPVCSRMGHFWIIIGRPDWRMNIIWNLLWTAVATIDSDLEWIMTHSPSLCRCFKQIYSFIIGYRPLPFLRMFSKARNTLLNWPTTPVGCSNRGGAGAGGSPFLKKANLRIHLMYCSIHHFQRQLARDARIFGSIMNHYYCETLVICVGWFFSCLKQQISSTLFTFRWNWIKTIKEPRDFGEK